MSIAGLTRLMAALHRNDNEPWPDDHELSGARRARGRLTQWTCDDGRVSDDPTQADASDRDNLIGVAHIGQPMCCLYAVASGSSGYGALAYVEFADGVRCDCYTSDCAFD